MYAYEWDSSTGGYILTPMPLAFSKEPRPVYYKELDILGFDKYWDYDKNDSFPYMWAEANNYYYRGRLVAKTKGGSLYTPPELVLIEDPEPEGYPLRFVDIPAMVDKNRQLMEQLVQETIKKIYNRNLLGGLYRENPVKSRNYEAVKSSKKWENVGNSYIIPALLLYRYSYI